MKKKTLKTKKISTENKKINPIFIFTIIVFIFIAFALLKIFTDNNSPKGSIEVKTTNSSTVKEKPVERTADKESVLKLMTILSSEEKNNKAFESAFNIIKKENLDIDTTDNDGKTVLMYAAFYDDFEIIESIIKKGADINKTDNEGRTALHWAAYYGKEEAVNALLKNGADKNIKDKLSNTALELAEFEGYENIINVLR